MRGASEVVSFQTCAGKHSTRRHAAPGTCAATPLLGRDLPALPGSHYTQIRAGWISAEEVRPVLVNQRGAVPRIERLHQRATGIEEIAHCIGRPFPGVLDDRMVHIGHGYP